MTSLSGGLRGTSHFYSLAVEARFYGDCGIVVGSFRKWLVPGRGVGVVSSQMSKMHCFMIWHCYIDVHLLNLFSVFSIETSVLVIEISEASHTQTYLSLVRKPVIGFPTRSDTNRAVQPQEIARGLKFWI